MRRVYLVRHAMPDIPLGERWCVGRTDLPLGPPGHLQAALLPFVPELRDKPVFCSRLIRAGETAFPLCPSPLVRNGLEEQDMGAWDGLSFSQIRDLFPDLYAARENNPNLMPPGSEPMESVRSRMTAAVQACLLETSGDIVIVSHKSAIASITGHRERLGYTSVSVLDEFLIPLSVGVSPHPPLTEEVCLALLRAAGTPEPVVAHSAAVAKEALRLLESGSETLTDLDRELLYSAALLHDIARTEPNHASLGAAWIRTLGYPETADVLAQHHDLRSTELDEAAVLYLADKYIQGTRRVSLETRFRESEKKCGTEAARKAHARRYETARCIEKQINRS